MHNQAEQDKQSLTASSIFPKYQQALHTVKQFANTEKAFTEAAVRNLIFKAESRHSSTGVIPGNGLIDCGAIIRVGRKVLIDGDKFLDWVRQHSGGSK